MKYKIEVFLLALIFMSSFVYAFDSSLINGFEVPSKFKGLIGVQKANVFIDENFSFSVEVREGKVYSSNVQLEKSSLDVYVQQATINRIETSSDKAGEALKAYKSGEIRIVKNTFMNKIKFFFARFFIR